MHKATDAVTTIINVYTAVEETVRREGCDSGPVKAVCLGGGQAVMAVCSTSTQRKPGAVSKVYLYTVYLKLSTMIRNAKTHTKTKGERERGKYQ